MGMTADQFARARAAAIRPGLEDFDRADELARLLGLGDDGRQILLHALEHSERHMARCVCECADCNAGSERRHRRSA